MKKGADWYPREPRPIIDAIRAAKMTALQAALYNLVLDLIYEGAGETDNDPVYFSCHFTDVSPEDAARAVDALCNMPRKLQKVGSTLTQPRAQREAKSKASLSEVRSKAGREGGLRSGETRRNKGLANGDEANGEAKRTREEKKREEKKREEKKRRSPDGDLFDDGEARPTEGEPTFLDERLTDIPDEWLKGAMERGNLTETEARDAWEEFRTYWLDLKAKKNRKGLKSDWKRTFLNYAAGSICQNAVGARRRNARDTDAGGTHQRPASLIARTAERYR